jgi:hypothetical protein
MCVGKRTFSYTCSESNTYSSVFNPVASSRAILSPRELYMKLYLRALTHKRSGTWKMFPFPSINMDASCMNKPRAKPDRRKYFTPTRRQRREPVYFTQQQTEIPPIDSLCIRTEVFALPEYCHIPFCMLLRNRCGFSRCYLHSLYGSCHSSGD